MILRFLAGAWRNDNGNAVDMVEVVHCSECKYFQHINQYYAQCADSYKYFPLWKEDPSKHFCSWGEKREEK